MNFQSFCVETIFHILNNKELTNDQLHMPSYIYAIKDGLIGLYAETYKYGDIEFKFWQINFSSKGKKNTICYRGNKIWKKLFSSQKAADIANKLENGLIKEDDLPSKDTIYYEHIEPKKIIFEKLINLRNNNVTIKNIREILDKSKLIMLTKDQSKFLDSSENNKFTEQDKKTIEDWFYKNKINKKQFEESINSMIIDGEYQKCKSNGTALARLAHLANHDVKFCWNLKPISEEELPSKFLEYVEDDHFIDK